MSKVWFITGSSRGFGRELTLAALKAGDAVAATARRPDQLADLVSEYGDGILPLQLDVTDAHAAQAAVTAARNRFGRIDVVVNNAGYANVAPIETGDDGDFRAQFETNFWGVYHVSKAAIPVLHEQGSGLIIQFSSMEAGSAVRLASRPTRQRSSPSTDSPVCCKPRRRPSASRCWLWNPAASPPTGRARLWRSPTSRSATRAP
ncbi:MAG: hypothetical protein QOD90_2225 [Mycobacterium sp.]|nr:hypothetical protein [Mycobacterium sp.]